MQRNPAFLADPAPKPKRRNPAEDPAYLAWCHEHLLCVITWRPVFVVHHLRRDPGGPMGTGHHDDRWVLPIVHELHDAQCKGSIHDMGEQNFFEAHGLPCYVSLSAMIRAAFEMQDPQCALQAILRAKKSE